MTDHITLTSPGLFAFLDRLGLSASDRDRVIEIDRQLSEEIDSDAVNGDRCALLVFEAAGLIADRLIVDRDSPLFDWSGWDDEPSDAEGFDFDGIDWGEE